ncbi:hypothetical protein SAMN05421805_1011750 [Saccharopolyspora antimicrobica]|uniref:Uncharacterized protein n=1 Tax=Saccharopolyspora antimicrobica TaxID=455193 RepID=A0A1I4U716_9PSEU|nr:hypothetical protein [Saccharopolyspora antimicrobica]RKT88709.1 hypothetical protein ATL45_7148 [Saccharopolyspora antimicrobica]SFM84640.1 hypothetical protein SAMN05421805_1011750 [Saccharopolyspora antimicrobica]
MIQGQVWQRFVAMSIGVVLVVPHALTVGLSAAPRRTCRPTCRSKGLSGVFNTYAIFLGMLTLITFWFLPETKSVELGGDAPARLGKPIVSVHT